jgi:hypothetical protein
LHWLAEWAAWQWTTRQIGEDGLTAYQRVRGRMYAKRLVRFAERVLYQLPPKGPNAPASKLAARWEYGFVVYCQRN